MTKAGVGFMAAFAVAASAASALAQTPDAIAVSQIWARATPGGAKTAAVYFTLTSAEPSPDRLLGGDTPVAQMARVHEMRMANGVMEMRPFKDGLPIPANGIVTLKPGADHLMLTGLKQPLKAGQSFALTLNFANAGAIRVQVPVRPIGAAGPGAAAKLDSGMEMK